MLRTRAPLPSIPNKAACSWPICSPPGSTANPAEKSPRRLSMNPKIAEHHHSRSAYVYLRQSTPGQVLHHQESTERQYALREKAQELGWSEAAIRTLDRDLGKTGTQTAGREDFKTLVADVSMGQVGAVFALEVSRLSRSDLDWHRLLELCALTQTLVIDEDGCCVARGRDDRADLTGHLCSEKVQRATALSRGAERSPLMTYSSNSRPK